MKRSARTQSRNDGDKLTAHFTTGQLVIAICVTLLFAVTTFLLGVLVGRYDPSLHDQSSQAGMQQAAPSPDVADTPGRTSSATETSGESPRQGPGAVSNDADGALERLRQKALGRMANRSSGSRKGAPDEPRVRELVAPPAPETPVSDKEPAGPLGSRSPGAPIRLQPSGSAAVPGQLPFHPVTPSSTSTTPEPEPGKAENAQEMPAATAPENDGPEAAFSGDEDDAVQTASAEPLPEPESSVREEPAQTPPESAPADADDAAEEMLTEEAAAAPPLFTPEGYGIQMASFLGEDGERRAQAFQEQLQEELACETTILKSQDERYYRVVIVGYADRALASAACAELKKRPGFADIFVRSLSDNS